MKGLKKVTFVVIALFTLILAGCGSDNSGQSGSSAGGTVKLSLAHIFPDSHPGGIYLNKLAEEVKEKTNGSVEIEIHHNAVLGSEADEIQQLQAGNLDMALLYGISNFQNIDARLGIEELPFVFDNSEHAHKALDGEYGKAVSEILKSHGFNVVSYWENGFRHFTNNKNAINQPEDMKGIKFRSAEVPIRLEMFKQLEASAIPMGFNEVFTALQQGTIDGQENPLSLIDSSKFYEVQEYLSLSGHIYNSAVLTISPASLEKLTPEQQEILKEVAEKLKVEERQLIAKQDAELAEQLKSNGMKVNEIDKQAFQEAVAPVWDNYTKQHGDELLKLIQDAR